MKKKILITSVIILVIFILALILTLRRPAEKETPLFTQEKAARQTQDDLTSAAAIKAVHDQFPWYAKMPIEAPDYRIVYDFDKKSFRIRLLTKSTETIKQAALDQLETIGVDLKQYEYYFIEPETGFENLLR
ncbi:MAG: hypothetical protein U1C50_02785 [Patescibacteria group bacterium]|nr:hypothetical protein [Patescibacteria group bacterium]